MGLLGDRRLEVEDASVSVCDLGSQTTYFSAKVSEFGAENVDLLLLRIERLGPALLVVLQPLGPLLEPRSDPRRRQEADDGQHDRDGTGGDGSDVGRHG